MDQTPFDGGGNLLESILHEGMLFDFRLNTHLTNIKGFTELLAGAGGTLTPGQLWEYREIVAASVEALMIETSKHRTLLVRLCGPKNLP